MIRPKMDAISVRIETKNLRKLDQLSAMDGRSRSWHIERALEAYLDAQAWQIGHIKKGIADLDAGRTVDHAEVSGWLLGWDADDEREPPG